MLKLHIRFLAGRFYATAWDHQVNEGTVEWPPSPWRILRALVAARYRLPNPPSDETFAQLVARLAAVPPAYDIPVSTSSHTRHFMPLDNAGLPGDKSALIVNAFVAPGSGPDADDGVLTVAWPGVTLDEPSLQLLQELCDLIPYLGRAESWTAIEASACDDDPSFGNCVPVGPDDAGSAGETIKLMTVNDAGHHKAWLAGYRAAKVGKKVQLPETLLDILRQDTGRLRKDGWSAVPGTRWATYRHSAAKRPPRRRAPKVRPFRCAVLALSSPVLPTVERTLEIGEKMHAALVKASDRGGRQPLDVFTGLGPIPDGQSSRGHAAVLPISWSTPGHISHLLVHARDGLDSEACEVVQRVRELRFRKGYSQHLTVMALWRDEDLEGIANHQLPPELRRGTDWRSTTPFILPRHPKKARDRPQDQLALELRRRGHELAEIIDERSGLSVGSREIPWYRYQRTRRHGGGKVGSTKGHGFTVRLAEPVRGPVAIGYGRFYGLGQLACLASE